MRAIIKDLKVVNYVAERYIKDIRECADLAKDSQHREDILIVATKPRVSGPLKRNARSIVICWHVSYNYYSTVDMLF